VVDNSSDIKNSSFVRFQPSVLTSMLIFHSWKDQTFPVGNMTFCFWVILETQLSSPVTALF
jgi:hypothetical protein